MIRCAIQRGSLSWVLLGSVGGLAAGIGFLLALAWLAVLLGRFRRWLSLTPEKRAEEKALKKHLFYKVSLRGRAAYLVLCFDQALRFTGQDFAAWETVRRELRRVTEENFETWSFRAIDLLPDEILSAGSRADLIAQREHTAFPGYAFSEAEFAAFRALYTQAGDALAPLSFLMERILDVAICGCEAGTQPPHTPDSLPLIDQANAYMQSRGIPLPDEPAVLFLLHRQRSPGIGKPFQMTF